MLLSGLEILIADDEPDLREILMEELQDRGATVTGVEDGNQAWTALSACRRGAA